MSDNPHFERECFSTTCCYAVYHTCYKKDQYGNLTYIPDSTTINTYQNIPVNCQPPCISGNCNKWFPPDPCAGPAVPCPPCCSPGGGGPANPKIMFGEGDVKDNLCNITLKSDNLNISYSIDLECVLNGKIRFEIIDILGNIIMNKGIDKNTYKISIPIDLSLHSGIYFIRVNIDGSLLYYNKFNIVK